MAQITNVLVPALCRAVLVACVGMLVYILPSLCYFIPFRWEEERYTDGVKWKFLEHKGPVFAPPYEPLPSNVKFYYDGTSFNHSMAVHKDGRSYSGVALIGLPSKRPEKQVLGCVNFRCFKHLCYVELSVFCFISLLKTMSIFPTKLKVLYSGCWSLASITGFTTFRC